MLTAESSHLSASSTTHSGSSGTDQLGTSALQPSNTQPLGSGPPHRMGGQGGGTHHRRTPSGFSVISFVDDTSPPPNVNEASEAPSDGSSELLKAGK